MKRISAVFAVTVLVLVTCYVWEILLWSGENFAGTGDSQEMRGGIEEVQRVEAAKAFARQLAPEGTEEYARAFREAMETTARLQAATVNANSEAYKQRGIETDDRYRQNLERMTKNPHEKIWGGARVQKGAFPDTVAVLGAGAMCTGTLIAPAIVLTAAHCPCSGVQNEVIFGEDTEHPADKIRVDRTKTKTMIKCQQQSLREGDLAVLFLERASTVPPERQRVPNGLPQHQTYVPWDLVKPKRLIVNRSVLNDSSIYLSQQLTARAR